MKKKIPTQYIHSDIHKAQANIFDSKAVDSLHQNISKGWEPKSWNKFNQEAEQKKLSRRELEDADHSYNEQQHYANLAHYIIALKPLIDAITALKSVDPKNAAQIKLYFARIKLYMRNLRESGAREKNPTEAKRLRVKENLTNVGNKKIKFNPARLHMQSQDAREIFAQIENHLCLILTRIMTETPHAHLITEAQGLMDFFQSRGIKKNVGSHFTPVKGMKTKLIRKVLEKTPKIAEPKAAAAKKAPTKRVVKRKTAKIEPLVQPQRKKTVKKTIKKAAEKKSHDRHHKTVFKELCELKKDWKYSA